MKKILTACLVTFLLSACNQRPVTSGTLEVQDFGTTLEDSAQDVAATSTGVYTVGYTVGSLDGTNKGSIDGFIRKYVGGVVWAHQFGTRTGDIANDIAVDSVGNSYVSGLTAGALGLKIGSNDGFLRKYNSNGVLQWTQQFGTTGSDFAADVTLDNSSNIYTVSRDNFNKFVIRKWNGNGNLLLTINISFAALVNDPRALAVDASGNIYLLAAVVRGSTYDAVLYKYSSTGVAVAGFPKRVYSTANRDYPYDMKLDSVGNIYFTLRDDGAGKGAYLRKLNSDGATLWTKKLEPTALTGETLPYALAVDTSNNVYVTGTTGGTYTGFTNAGFADIFVLKYNPTGSRLWTKQFGGNQDDYAYGIAISDGVYLVGQSLSNPNLLGDSSYGDFDAYLAKLDAVNGAVLGIDQ